ncbi:MAG: TolC family protein [Muribaculaceae bacterium]|nr:TolC family protein [Muribaculaceae bacterium]
MTKKMILLLVSLVALAAVGQTPLATCQQAAQANYPLIKQRDLIARTTDYTVENLRKGWLPQVSFTAQATLQSDVTAWPDEMREMMSQRGVEIAGLKKDQYRIGLDVNQNVWDGGMISSQTAVARERGNVQAAQTEVDLYAVRRRVNEMYFSLLLLDEQLQLNADHQSLLASSEKKLASLYAGGVVAESDYNTIRAERLVVEQQRTSLVAQRNAVALMLSELCGITVTQVCKPPMVEVSGENHRPELQLVDAQLRLADAQERVLNAALMPRLSVFAQGYYGYPGYNMFEDMMRRKFSLNGMVGARLTWNIGALYTRRADKAKLQLQRDQAENSREVFLLNNRLDIVQQDENIARYRQLMKSDDEIIALRARVRESAESKLAHGIIDVNDLVKEINNEQAARVQRTVHEIELLKQMYDKKIAINN